MKVWQVRCLPNVGIYMAVVVVAEDIIGAAEAAKRFLAGRFPTVGEDILKGHAFYPHEVDMTREHAVSGIIDLDEV